MHSPFFPALAVVIFSLALSASPALSAVLQGKQVALPSDVYKVAIDRTVSIFRRG